MSEYNVYRGRCNAVANIRQQYIEWMEESESENAEQEESCNEEESQ